MRYLCIS